MKKSLHFILGRKKKVVEYPSMSKFTIPQTVSMPAYSFYGKIERHVRYYKTLVPSGKITWGVLIKYNPRLLKVQQNIVDYEGHDFSDKALNTLAVSLVSLIKEEFLLIQDQKFDHITQKKTLKIV